jgi:hypothetical protein
MYMNVCTAPQRNAATELGELLLDSLEEQNRVADEKTLGMLVSIADAFPPSMEQIIFLKVFTEMYTIPNLMYAALLSCRL